MLAGEALPFTDVAHHGQAEVCLGVKKNRRLRKFTDFIASLRSPFFLWVSERTLKKRRDCSRPILQASSATGNL